MHAPVLSTSRDTTLARSTHLLPFPITWWSSRLILVPGRYPRGADVDDPYGDDHGDDIAEGDVANGRDDNDNIDTDVLPTLLAYRGGMPEGMYGLGYRGQCRSFAEEVRPVMLSQRQ